MMNPPEAWQTLSLLVGKKIPAWTQGPGGNVSCKIDQTLWIKASGTRLDGAGKSKSVAKVELEPLLLGLEALDSSDALAEEQYLNILKSSAQVGDHLGQPSMETGFHAWLGAEVVAHFHSLAAVLLADQYARDPQRVMNWLVSRTGETAFLPPIRPGLTLAQKIKHCSGAKVLILQNHGVILIAEEIDQALPLLQQWEGWEREFARDWNYPLLLNLLQAESREEVTATLGALPPTPLKLYFPDSAVFYERLKGILVPIGVSVLGETLFGLSKLAHEKDPDAVELWMATAALYHCDQGLASLPDFLVREIPGLPTELYRQGAEASR